MCQWGLGFGDGHRRHVPGLELLRELEAAWAAFVRVDRVELCRLDAVPEAVEGNEPLTRFGREVPEGPLVDVAASLRLFDQSIVRQEDVQREQRVVELVHQHQARLLIFEEVERTPDTGAVVALALQFRRLAITGAVGEVDVVVLIAPEPAVHSNKAGVEIDGPHVRLQTPVGIGAEVLAHVERTAIFTTVRHAGIGGMAVVFVRQPRALHVGLGRADIDTIAFVAVIGGGGLLFRDAPKGKHHRDRHHKLHLTHGFYLHPLRFVLSPPW